MKLKRFAGLLTTLLLVMGALCVNSLAASEDEGVFFQITPMENTTSVLTDDLVQVEVTKRTFERYASAPSYDDADSAADYLRDQMEARAAVIEFGLEDVGDDPSDTWLEIFDAALEHTGEPTEGDYIHWQCTSYAGGWYSYGGDYTFVYEIEYKTTAQQEAEMDAAVDKLLTVLDLYDSTDYEKVCGIYQFMCANISYDNENLADSSYELKYTAYAALINGTAVCQGYANLFYRLALELGVDSRIITGYGDGVPHAWNIIELDGRCYNLDATWDALYGADVESYSCFLRCDDNFYDHTRAEEYATETFYSQYPMDSMDYVDRLACALPAPELKASPKASTGKPYLSWSEVEGAVGYRVYCADEKSGVYSELTQTTALYVTHTEAEVGEDYFYKVLALNEDGVEGRYSDVKGVWCDLARPTVTVSNRASDGKPYISWTAVEGATGYEVYRCGTSGGTYTKMYTASASKLNVTHTGAVVGNDYFYKVRAIYGSNTSCNSALTAAKGVWCDLPRPAVTVSNRASDGKPVISWTAVEGATGYAVYRCGTSTGTYTKMYTASASKLSVAHIGAVAGEDYFYKVKALYSGNSKCDSAQSTYKGVYCDLARPTLTVELNSKGKPYLTWNEVEGADGYVVYRSTSANGTYTKLFTAGADRLYCTHSGAAADTTYYYKVIALCEATSKGNSAYSLVKSVTAQ